LAWAKVFDSKDCLILFFTKRIKKIKSICRIAGLYYFCSLVSALGAAPSNPPGWKRSKGTKSERPLCVSPYFFLLFWSLRSHFTLQFPFRSKGRQLPLTYISLFSGDNWQ
jgi:hypothetical protein